MMVITPRFRFSGMKVSTHIECSHVYHILHTEMSSYLRSLDVYDHPISTSFSHPDGDQTVQALMALNFTMTHNYGSSDIATIATQYVSSMDT